MLKYLVFLLISSSFLLVSSGYAQDSTEEPPESGEIVVRVWWPDDLYPLDNENALTELQEQIERFNQENAFYNVELRLKPSEGGGSVLSTLSTAQPVAPNAIPDLVLLSRKDMVSAARNGLIRQIEDWVPDSLRNDLLPRIIELGIHDDLLYGVPYAVQIEHLAYYSTSYEDPIGFSYETILNSQQELIFAGEIDSGVNDVLLAQYVAAGGRLVDDAGLPTLDEEPLRDVLAFYEQGLSEGIFTADILDYSSPATYWGDFLEENSTRATITTSTLYLQSAADYNEIAISGIPNIEDEPVLIIDGWMWALTTSNPDQQMGALAFIEWIMSAEAQADYTQAFGVLPSRQRALRIWGDNDYIAQLEEWIQDGILISVEQPSRTVADQIQAAFEAVLSGALHEEAVEDALEAISSSGS